MFPEYYEVIENPMDIFTVSNRMKSGNIVSIGEALNDIRQIWDNCRIYNAEESEIYEMANEMDNETERIVEVRLIV